MRGSFLMILSNMLVNGLMREEKFMYQVLMETSKEK